MNNNFEPHQQISLFYRLKQCRELIFNKLRQFKFRFIFNKFHYQVDLCRDCFNFNQINALKYNVIQI